MAYPKSREALAMGNRARARNHSITKTGDGGAALVGDRDAGLSTARIFTRHFQSFALADGHQLLDRREI